MNDIEDKLLWAITDNNPEQVSFFLKAGADPNFIDCFDETPLIYACRCNDIKPEVIEALLKYGADPNQLEGNGFSSLLLAVTRENLKIVNILLDAGANANLTLQGKNIIWYSLQSSNPNMLEFILKHTGVDINSTDDDTGYNSLDWSLFHHMNNYISSLKSLGANNNIAIA